LTARAPIARAAASGDRVVVRDRASLEQSYPDAIVFTPYARAAVAVPLRIAGKVVGSISCLYDDEAAMIEDAEAVAQIAADLGGQARARRASTSRVESRRALDRILRMSPAFHADSEEEVTEAVCREARMAFGADVGVLWKLDGRKLRARSLRPGARAHGSRPRGKPRRLPRLRMPSTTCRSPSSKTCNGGDRRVSPCVRRRAADLRIPVVIAGGRST
jgi:GAF domain-containing protein